MQKIFEPFLKKFDISMMHLYILVHINDKEEKNISALCKETCINQGNLSTMCKSLEKLGYIERKRSKEDERVVLLKATPKGSEVIKNIMCHSSAFDYVFNQIEPQQIDIIIQGIKELENMINKLMTEQERKNNA